MMGELPPGKWRETYERIQKARSYYQTHTPEAKPLRLGDLPGFRFRSRGLSASLQGASLALFLLFLFNVLFFLLAHLSFLRYDVR